MKNLRELKTENEILRKEIKILLKNFYHRLRFKKLIDKKFMKKYF